MAIPETEGTGLLLVGTMAIVPVRAFAAVEPLVAVANERATARVGSIDYFAFLPAYATNRSDFEALMTILELDVPVVLPIASSLGAQANFRGSALETVPTPKTPVARPATAAMTDVIPSGVITLMYRGIRRATANRLDAARFVFVM